MRKFWDTLVPSVGLVCLWLAAPSARAASTRAYVSVTGNDANICSDPATPCRTFSGAIAQLLPGGEVVVRDSGTYGGGTISQAVTINAAGVAALVAVPITVNAQPNDVVTFRGVTFFAPTPGTGTALTFNGGGGLNLEGCVFHGWATGLSFNVAGRLNVSDTTVRDHTATGIYLNSTTGEILASFERTRLLGNANGLWVASQAKATIRGSVISGNATGLAVSPNDGSLPELSVEACVVTHNSSAGVSSWGGTTRVSNSTVTNNGTGLYQAGPAVLVSRTNNTIEGNGTDTAGTIGTFVAK
jgi:hypothetical protein